MSCPYCHREGASGPSSAPAVAHPSSVPPASSAASAASPSTPLASSAASAASPSAPGSPPGGPGTATLAPSRKRFRGTRKTGWLLPGILLVLMPKCPICLAAYIALVTGISIPITAATWLRGSLIAICIGALVWLGVRCSLYLYRRAVH